MSAIHKRELDGTSYQFVCETWETSRAWGHRCILFLDGEEVTQQKIRYYNRTWESYRYQSVMRKCVYWLIDDRKQEIVDDWKSINNKKRISEKQRKQLYNDDIDLQHFYNLLDSI